MPTTDSAAKRARQNERNRKRNKELKTRVKTARKKVTDALKAGEEEEEVRQLLQEAISLIDKAVTKGVFHRNKGGRLKSRLHSRVKKEFQ